MKSDISRQTFNSRKHYNQVILQQGRVQLDADWNEQQDILQHRLNTQTNDMIGQGSASADSNGFQVTLTPDKKDLVISPGYIYVDGILCELEQEATVDVQSINVNLNEIVVSPQLVEGSVFEKNHWVELLQSVDENGQSPKNMQTPTLDKRLGFLKISKVNAPSGQDITLTYDQPDVTIPDPGKNKFKIRPVTTYLTQPYYFPELDPRVEGLPKLETRDNEDVLLVYLDVWQRQITAFNDPNIVEVALGGADTAQRSQTLWQVKVIPVHIDSPELLNALQQNTSKARQSQFEWEVGRLLRIFAFTTTSSINRWDALFPASTGRLSARLNATDDNATATYRGLENQLYHVEIHEGEDDIDSKSTFKWARNNASLLVEIVIQNGQVKVKGSGQGNLLGLAVGQYVELLDEETELLALPGHMAQIKQVDDVTGLLTLDSLPENAKQNRLRLWNTYAPIDGSKNARVSKDGWIPLESGVEIQFTPDGNYRSGDYWLIPARPARSAIEWPYKTPQPPAGIQHYYTRLACQLYTDKVQLPLLDCRKRFFPLAAGALHILDINWKNDFHYVEKEAEQLLSRGLRVTLDGSPDEECARAMQAAMTVSVETALPGGGAGIFIINGVFKVDQNVITWHWGRRQRQGFARFFARFDEWRSDLFDSAEHLQRVRIALKGHLIWHTSVNGRRIYLDGQAFGIPGEEKSGHMPVPSEKDTGKRIDLLFPSGTGRPASDLESWFYMEE